MPRHHQRLKRPETLEAEPGKGKEIGISNGSLRREDLFF